jgi:hypothetical protein
MTLDIPPQDAQLADTEPAPGSATLQRLIVCVCRQWLTSASGTPGSPRSIASSAAAIDATYSGALARM